MGRANVAAVCVRWSQLSDRAFRALVFMANVCRDEPDPVYFGGREAIADVLNAPHDIAGFRKVERAMTDLLRAGAIVVERRGGNGRRAEYRLTLDRPPQALEKPVDNESCPTPGVGQPDELPVTGDGLSPSPVTSCPTPTDGLSPSPSDGPNKSTRRSSPLTQEDENSPQASSSPVRPRPRRSRHPPPDTLGPPPPGWRDHHQHHEATPEAS